MTALNERLAAIRKRGMLAFMTNNQQAGPETTRLTTFLASAMDVEENQSKGQRRKRRSKGRRGKGGRKAGRNRKERGGQREERKDRIGIKNSRAEKESRR